ncbi:MAG: hypothetical protein ACYCXF_08010 [Thermoleophilia bacterium]
MVSRRCLKQGARIYGFMLLGNLFSRIPDVDFTLSSEPPQT